MRTESGGYRRDHLDALEERPDLLARVQEIRARERRAAALAAPHAVRRSGQHERGLTRVHDAGEVLKIGQHVLPLAAGGVSAENADSAGLGPGARHNRQALMFSSRITLIKQPLRRNVNRRALHEIILRKRASNQRANRSGKGIAKSWIGYALGQLVSLCPVADFIDDIDSVEGSSRILSIYASI